MLAKTKVARVGWVHLVVKHLREIVPRIRESRLYLTNLVATQLSKQMNNGACTHKHKWPPGVSLRAATGSDAGFVNNLTRAAMAAYVNATWNTEAEREAYFQKNLFNLETTLIIQLDEHDIGRISIIYSEEFVYLDNVHLHQDCQGRGIGKALINWVLHQAQCSGRYAKLMVLKTNPARKFYERNGFFVVGDDDERLYMCTMNPKECHSQDC